ncbi:MAG: ASKHA domain-containing protein [Desulfatiglandaceae bacterium]
MSDHQIELQPVGRRGSCPAGETLLACAHRLGVELVSVCGGFGKCRGCKVRVMAGRFSEATPAEREAFTEEELASGWRLACQTYPQNDCRVHVPPESLGGQQRLQVEGRDVDVSLDSPIRSFACRLEPPSLAKPVADAENLLEKISAPGPIHLDIRVLRDLSTRLREWDWNLKAHIQDRELVAVSPPGSRPFGLAVDLGSTKIAGYLIALDTGKTLASQAIMNPQISKGEDIITRINFAIRSSDGRTLMANLVREGLMKLAGDLCAEAGVETVDILEAVIVGNTAMHHLMLGLPVRQLAISPFVPAVCGDLNIKARDIGLDFAPGAYVYLPSNIAGFVGADHVAALTATDGEWNHGNGMVIDIGTNTEISLITRGKITSTSCASGPAFEGYQIRDGMRASPGAIEKVYLWGEDVGYKTIDEAEPIGICGSGILDAISQLYLAGVLDKGGRIQKGSHSRVVEKNGHLEFILVPLEGDRRGPEISITQKDVREVQLGKAAIQAAIEILMEAEAVSPKEIEKVIIAGAFGTYIDVSNAIAIGMLPSLPLSRFHQVGNAAGIGAKLLLLSFAKRKAVGNLLSRVKYLELAGTPEFSKAFTRACLLEPYHLNPDAEGG